MTMLIYDVGDLRRLTGVWKNSEGTNTDPGTVTFEIVEPDGTTTTYVYGTDAQLVKVTTGSYYVDWTFDQEGRHFVRWEGVGNVTAAEQQEIHIRREYR